MGCTSSTAAHNGTRSSPDVNGVKHGEALATVGEHGTTDAVEILPGDLVVNDDIGDSELHDIHKQIQDIGVEAIASKSPPFVAVLSAVLERIDWEQPEKKQYHVQMASVEDKSTSLPAAEFDGEQASSTFPGSQFVFVNLLSTTTYSLAVKDRSLASKTLVARGDFRCNELQDGDQSMSLPLLDPKTQDLIGTAVLKVSYVFKHGTRDEGMYRGPDAMFIDRRKMRSKGPWNMVERVSNVNHWLCSHDNIYTVKAAPKVMEPGVSFRSADADSQSPLFTESGLQSGLLSGLGDEDSSALPVDMLQECAGEALAPVDTDTPGVTEMKNALCGVVSMLVERIVDLEKETKELRADVQHVADGVQKKTNVRLNIVLDANPFVSGRFEYGAGRPARKRTVLVFCRAAYDSAAPGVLRPVSFLGSHTTDKAGHIRHIALPDEVADTPGHYTIVALLPGDNTFAKGSLFLLKPHTKCVVFDVDGTLTVGDKEVVAQFALNAVGASLAAGEGLAKNYDLKPRRQALSMVRLWAAKGYQPVYLSGRQGSFYNLTLAWLIRHGYPPGPIHLTRSHRPTLPMYFSVGSFKVDYIHNLRAKGLKVFAAYGNTGTDIKAYRAASIPLSRTFIVGPAGGDHGTVAVDNFTEHIQTVMGFPDSEVRLPYSELLHLGNLGYKGTPEYEAANHSTDEDYVTKESGACGYLPDTELESKRDDSGPIGKDTVPDASPLYPKA